MRRAALLLLLAGAALAVPAARRRPRAGRGDGRRQERRARRPGARRAEGAQRARERPALRDRPRDAAVGAQRAPASRFKLRDYGACSRRARDAGSLYVSKIGPDRERGRDGWVYKVGRRSGSAGAADPAGSFGTGRKLRAGQRVLWFWCVKNPADECQRTLATSSARSVAPGAPLAVTVRGYDEAGRGVRVAGATVRLGGASAVTGADGVATVAAPAAGRYRVRAEKAGMVVSFGERVAVG